MTKKKKALKGLTVYCVSMAALAVLVIFSINYAENYLKKVEENKKEQEMFATSVIVTLDNGIDIRVASKESGQDELSVYLQEYKKHLNERLKILGADTFEKTIIQEQDWPLVVIEIKPEI